VQLFDIDFLIRISSSHDQEARTVDRLLKTAIRQVFGWHDWMKTDASSRPGGSDRVDVDQQPGPEQQLFLFLGAGREFLDELLVELPR